MFKISQWLQKSWNSLLTYYRGKTIIEEESSIKYLGEADNEESQESQESQESKTIQSSHNEIKDKDLEFLFNQLLEGVVNGWQNHRIEQFFHKLEHRVTIEDWLQWLTRFESKVISSDSPNYQMAARMIILGEVTASLPFVRPIGESAYSIGEKLLNKSNNDLWKESLPSNLVSNLPFSEDQDNPSSPSSEQPFSVINILHQLQEDSALAKETAKNLGLKSTEPSLIIEKLLEQSKRIDNSNITLKNEETSEEQSSTEDTLKEDNELDTQSEWESETTSESPPQFGYPANWLENWFNSGLEKAQAGDFEGAIDAWDQVLEYNDQMVQAWHNRGTALAYLNRLEEAVESFNKAIAINVNDYTSWNDRGYALYNLKRWEEALISWDRVIGIEPNIYEAWYYRGLVFEKLNLNKEAIYSYEVALEIKPDDELAKKRKEALLQNMSKESMNNE